MRKLYSRDSVERYITKNRLWDSVEIIEGCLIDSYVIYHESVIETFEESYINEWSSGLERHIYREGLPKRISDAINAMYE